MSFVKQNKKNECIFSTKLLTNPFTTSARTLTPSSRARSTSAADATSAPTNAFTWVLAAPLRRAATAEEEKKKKRRRNKMEQNGTTRNKMEQNGTKWNKKSIPQEVKSVYRHLIAANSLGRWQTRMEPNGTNTNGNKHEWKKHEWKKHEWNKHKWKKHE
jgi:hypothetical protein